ncbi:MAG: hypothetical protein ABI162_12415 [Luteolibacter sp.]
MKKYRIYLHRLKMSDFIRVHSDKPWLVPLGILLRLFRPRFFESEQLYQSAVFDTDEKTVRGDGLALVVSKEAPLIAHGYRRVGLNLYRPPSGKIFLLGSLLYSPEERTMATVGISFASNGQLIQGWSGLITQVAVDRYMITSDVRGRFPDPVYVDNCPSVRGCGEKLIEAHANRIRGMERGWVDLTDTQVREEHVRRIERNYHYFHDLGIYGPLEPA